MEMGTGKTRVALELVKYNNVDLLLYFTPFSTIDNIKKEVEKWGVNCEYKIIGFETVSQSDTTYIDLLEYIKDKKVFIIADESIFIKNEGTKRYCRLMEIRKHCDYALILNGTPISKSEWDIYHQFRFLSYKIFNMSELEFQSTFFDHIKYKKRYEKPKDFYKFSDVNAEAFKKIIEPYVFKSSLNIDISESEEINLVDIDLIEYNKERDHWLSRMSENSSFEDVMSMLTSLNVISSLSVDKNNKVIEYIKGKQVIVYCNFLREVAYMASEIDCFTITGETKAKDRATIIEQFKNSNKPLIMTYGVGSYSLNLQFCNEIVYSSLNFDYSKTEQSKYRIKRIGQDRPIKYTYFIANCGLNRIIMTNLEQKKTMSNLVMEKINEGEADKWLKSI